MNVPVELLMRKQALEREIATAVQFVAVTQGRLEELMSTIAVIDSLTAPPADAAPAETPAVPPETSEEPQPRTRRDIRGMVLAALAACPTDMSVAEIAGVISASKHLVEKALEHHRERGKVHQPVEGRWAAVPADPMPSPAAETAPVAGETHADAVPAVTVFPSDDAEEENSEPPADESTQDRIVRLLKVNRDRGLTDDEFKAGGVPYVAVHQYQQAGWMVLKDGRYYLNPAYGESA